MTTARESRQRRWQLARVAEGRCAQRGNRRQHYRTVCDACAVKARRRNRMRQGLKPWTWGGMGRPPVVSERSNEHKHRQSGHADQ